MTVVVEGINGLGDNLYQRPFVKILAERDDVYIRTPWPELYADIPNVRFLKMCTILRTQSENVERQESGRWSEYPYGASVLEPRYGTHSFIEGMSLMESFARSFGLADLPREYDLPPLPNIASFGPKYIDKPIAIIRPVTLRSEWYNASRNPLAKYVSEIAARLMDTHYVVSVAHLKQGHEWLVGDGPPCHLELHHGELDVLQLLSFVKSAQLAVGGVGWIVPAAIYAGTPFYGVLGGHGGMNSPEFVTSPDMPMERVGWAMPDEFCRCINPRHDCDKEISNLLAKFDIWYKYCLES